MSSPATLYFGGPGVVCRRRLASWLSALCRAAEGVWNSYGRWVHGSPSSWWVIPKAQVRAGKRVFTGPRCACVFILGSQAETGELGLCIAGRERLFSDGAVADISVPFKCWTCTLIQAEFLPLNLGLVCACLIPLWDLRSAARLECS